MILFLDDSPERAAIAYERATPERRSHTIWCQTAEEAIVTLRDYELEEAHLDHDLGGTQYQDSRAENSGMEVVRWLEKLAEPVTKRHKKCLSIPFDKFQKTQFTVHSHNIPAARQMVERLRAIGLNVKFIPFGHYREVSV